MRAELAAQSGIDMDVGSRADVLQVNQSAKILWQAAKVKGLSADDLAERIRYVAGWCRKNAWECQPRQGRKGEQPSPAVIRHYWRQAIEDRERARGAMQVPAPGTDIPEPPPVVPKAAIKRAALAGNVSCINALERAGLWPLPAHEIALLNNAAPALSGVSKGGLA